MKRKIVNTIVLVGVLVLLGIIWAVIYFGFQKGKFTAKAKQIKQLRETVLNVNPAMLREQIETLLKEAATMDSLLANRKYNIPLLPHQSRFFSFVNENSTNFSPLSTLNIDYKETRKEGEFLNFIYSISGKAKYNEIYSLIYAIENSKELKKVVSGSLTNAVVVDEFQFPNFLVNYSYDISVYYSTTNRFVSSLAKENNLQTGGLHDIFFPLIRGEIPPNFDNLLDVQDAKLLALLPDGVYLSNNKSDSYFLREGDPVYLGYLTSIDKDNNFVIFMINKGGLLESIRVDLLKGKAKEAKK